MPFVEDRQLLLRRPLYQETICLSDGQPDANPDAAPTDGQESDQVKVWRDVLREITQYHPNAGALIHAGDVVDRGHPSAAEIEANTAPWYSLSDAMRDFETLLPFSEVYAISGNHDRDYRTFADRPYIDPFRWFTEYFSKTFFYVKKGNTVYIFMGDMGDTTAGYITNYVFEWWLSVCRRYKNNNKIVVTHHSIPDVGLRGDAYSATNDDIVQLGLRFVDAMTKGPAEDRVKIDLWLRGHYGTATSSNPLDQSMVSHDGCLFVNIGLHIPSALESGASDLSYVVMCTTDGSADVVLKRWDHKAKDFITSAEVTHRFSHPLVLASTVSFDGRYQQSDLDPINGTQTYYQHVEFNSPKTSAKDYKTSNYWFSRGIITDLYGFNLPKHEAGHKIELAGGLDTEADNRTHNYGFAAAWVAERTNGTENDYSADFVGYGSGAGKTDDSKVEAFRGHSDGSLSTPKGLRADYVSDWTFIHAADLQRNGTDFAHNLNVPDPHIVDVEVWFHPGPGLGSRVFNWSGSSSAADAARFNGSVSCKDGNTITISVGDRAVFSVDNVDGAGTQSFAFGYFLVIANRKPGLPALPT